MLGYKGHQPKTHSKLMTKSKDQLPRRITHQENCRNHYITHLRHIQLENDYLTFKLADLINAYRPHTDPSYDDHTDKRYVSKLSMKDLIKQAQELT